VQLTSVADGPHLAQISYQATGCGANYLSPNTFISIFRPLFGASSQRSSQPTSGRQEQGSPTKKKTLSDAKGHIAPPRKNPPNSHVIWSYGQS